MKIKDMRGSHAFDEEGNKYSFRCIAKVMEGQPLDFEYVIRKNGRDMSRRLSSEEAEGTLEEYLKIEKLNYVMKGRMVKMYEWSDLIEKWAVQRGLHEMDNLQGQMLKLSEEAGELAGALLDNNDEEIKDAAGDTMVVLRISALQYGHNFQDILDSVGQTDPNTPDMVKGQLGVYSLFKAVGQMSALAARSQEVPFDLYVQAVRAVLEVVNYRPLKLKPEDWFVEDACYFAYGHIKGRKGVVYNNVFVKSEDVYKSGDAELIALYEERFPND